MGFTVQFESHRVELPAIHQMEHDPDILEFYDQPPPIKLVYEGPDGKRRGFLHTPDFFVLRRNIAGWEEWKTEERLRELSGRNPNRFVHESGRWSSPPAELYAAGFGLHYHLRSANEIDWIFQRNILFLEDYFLADAASVHPTARERLLAHVFASPGISLDQLTKECSSLVSADDIYILIATGELRVDLHAAPLTDAGRVRVFGGGEIAMLERRPDTPKSRRTGCFSQSFYPGTIVTWDGCDWQVVNAGERQLSLLRDGKGFINLPAEIFESLVREGHIKQIHAEPELRERPGPLSPLSKASPCDLRIANYRAKIVQEHLFGGAVCSEARVSRRTVRRFK